MLSLAIPKRGHGVHPQKPAKSVVRMLSAGHNRLQHRHSVPITRVERKGVLEEQFLSANEPREAAVLSCGPQGDRRLVFCRTGIRIAGRVGSSYHWSSMHHVLRRVQPQASKKKNVLQVCNLEIGVGNSKVLHACCCSRLCEGIT